MIIETKFNFNQFVYPIVLGGFDKFVNCKTCKGKGNVTIIEGKKEINCPQCYGRKGEKKYIHDKWMIKLEFASEIGKINFDLYADENEKSTRRYMIESTGIGSGTLWEEENLFTTIDEAKQECDKRNGVTCL